VNCICGKKCIFKKNVISNAPFTICTIMTAYNCISDIISLTTTTKHVEIIPRKLTVVLTSLE
jgi:hypothetical protein